MCVIAGYTGSKRAAPVLIDMLQKIEYFDGGCATGIATIHEGKLYVAKAIGDVEMLLRTTDALNLPGTTGIIHSRPGFDYMSTTHPYQDAQGKLALVTNGTLSDIDVEKYFAQARSIMDDFLDREIVAPTSRDLNAKDYPRQCTKDGKPFYTIEPLALTVGDLVKDTPREEMKDTMAKAVKYIHEIMPADQLSVNVHANLPDTITIGTISRPMSVLEAEGETYIASAALAFPEDIQGKITHLPQGSVSQVTSKGLDVYAREMEGVRVGKITEPVLQYFQKELETRLVGKQEKPLSIYELNIPRTIWSESVAGYHEGQQMFKPHTAAICQMLWRFHQEQRLHSRLGVVYARDVAWPNTDRYFTKFWLD